MTTASSTLPSTASMLADTEALHHGEAASESSATQFPITSARCSLWPTQAEWVPDREQQHVPPELASMCQGCPGRPQCLSWALAGREEGYWAGTTTRQRAAVLEQGGRAPTRLLADVDDHDPHAGALHVPGQASAYWYSRRGCRCTGCKRANADQRATERARARARAA